MHTINTALVNECASPYAGKYANKYADKHAGKRLIAAVLLSALFLFTGVVFGFMQANAAESGADAVDPSLTQVVSENEEIVPLGNPVAISAGHVDLGAKFVDGKWEFLARDDTSATPKWRHLQDVVFQVSDAAKIEIPQDDEQFSFLNANGSVWAVPQTEIKDVVWLGWNTQDPQVVSQIQNGVNIIYAGHQGEGDFNVFVQAGNFAGPQQLWNSSKKESQPIHVEANTHTHANWIFAKPGTHLVRLTIQAQLKDGSTVSDTQILHFAVGSDADPQAALNEKWTTNNLPEAPADIAQPSAIDKSNQVVLFVAIGLIVAAAIIIAIAFGLRKRNQQQKEIAKQAVVGER